jgi:hypothetical protein
MPSLVTYDVPEKHVELKKKLFKLGYLAQISTQSCPTFYFPNTTFYHSTKTPLQAREDVKAICKKIQIDLERCVATIWDSWAAICGQPFNNH